MGSKMPKNRKKTIELFVGNLANAALHAILEKAVKEEGLRTYYEKEFTASLRVAMKYREELNPKVPPFPERDFNSIREQLIKKVTAELEKRIKIGYGDINLAIVGLTVDQLLAEASLKL